MLLLLLPGCCDTSQALCAACCNVPDTGQKYLYPDPSNEADIEEQAA